MKYKKINEEQRRRMDNIMDKDPHIEFFDPDFLKVLVAKLPRIEVNYRENKENEKVKEYVKELENLLSSYNIFTTNKQVFLEEIKQILTNIKEEDLDWNRFNLYKLENTLDYHDSRLISGPGGIGKSYFIRKYEGRLEEENIPHLCFYGKFEKDLEDIDSYIHEIIAETSGFIFIVDAINEMSDKGQEKLLKVLDEFKKYDFIKIILTYRDYSMEQQTLEKFKEHFVAEYSFPGVSFESTLDGMIKLGIPNLYMYEDILYTNNPLILKVFGEVLKDPKFFNDTRKKSLVSITYILEQSIKRILKKDKRFVGLNKWKDTKEIAKWMYVNETKIIDKKNLISVTEQGTNYLDAMLSLDFMVEQGGLIYFKLDLLSDYLIARSLFADISKKNITEKIKVINKKIANTKLHSIRENVILVIFDQAKSGGYEEIFELLKQTNLLQFFYKSVLLKIKFEEKDILKFQKVFKPKTYNNLLTTFGGYTDKPFNCVNYLNDYYKEERQYKELSIELDGKFLNIEPYDLKRKIIKRLKNILYFINIVDDSDKQLDEAFYFSIWCCASPVKEIRVIATKLLYDILQKGSKYRNKLIKEYKDIYDFYIKESIIFVLSKDEPNNMDIIKFFKDLIISEKYLSAKSIKRMSEYLNEEYISWDRPNFYNYKNDAHISEKMHNLLFDICLKNKNFFPFEYRGRNKITMHDDFLAADKKEVYKFNKYLEENYSCVKVGYCNGRLCFEDFVKEEVRNNFDLRKLDNKSFFYSFEKILFKILDLYEVSIDLRDYIYEDDFKNSLFMKCVDIATGIYYGSLMCNYYTSEFVSYNYDENSIGYVVYNPIKYGEELLVTSPVPKHQSFVEKLGDCVVKNLDIPQKKNIKWAKDIKLMKENLLNILKPVKIKKEDWVLLAGRISFKEKESSYMAGHKSGEVYDIWCCTSLEETIKDDGEARYLTIELDEYIGRLIDYNKCENKPWLCKSVPGITGSAEIFEYANLVLPPVELISFFDLNLNEKNMSWINKSGEKVIVCNNDKSSYYSNGIMSSVFIKKKYLDEYLKENTLKYFAYSDKFIQRNGNYSRKDYHFEIQEDKIIKKVSNQNFNYPKDRTINEKCENCPHGFNYQEIPIENLDELYKKLGIDYKK